MRMHVHRHPDLWLTTHGPSPEGRWLACLESRANDQIAFARGRTEREAVRKLDRKVVELRDALSTLDAVLP